MTEKLPRVTASDATRVLEKAGFSFSRQSGSHKIYKNREGRRDCSLSFWKSSSSKGFKEYPKRCGFNHRGIYYTDEIAFSIW